MISVDPEFELRNLNILDSKQRTDAGVRKGFYLAGKSIVKESRRLMTVPPKTGRVYMVRVGVGGRKLVRSRSHVSSAAGQAPAKITGALMRSVNFKVHGSNELIVGSESKYGAFLENGTIKMKPRPYLNPAIKNETKNTVKYLGNNIIKSINK